MTDCREVTSCRVCGGALETALDLGTQCLAGSFPAADEPDPPAFPLLLCRCAGCGLAQLGHTIDPELMFRDYFYQSGVTETMRRHLKGVAAEAVGLLGRTPRLVLDIGCNDGELLSNFHRTETVRVGVDPCKLAAEAVRRDHAAAVYHAPWPVPALRVRADLIFSVACFYDADDPVAFAAAVRDSLSPGGLWCVEVADCWAMVEGLRWDSVLHEHLCYYDLNTLSLACHRAGLGLVRHSYNDCNGGSLRAYYRPVEYVARETPLSPYNVWRGFAGRVAASADRLEQYLHDCRRKGLAVHLLGASSKSNTVLQYASTFGGLIQMASDRDPRKAGRRTPGTGIPIVSEEESRAAVPDVYLSLLSHFRDEVVAREAEFLGRGGRLAFALPKLEEAKQ